MYGIVMPCYTIGSIFNRAVFSSHMFPVRANFLFGPLNLVRGNIGMRLS